MLLDETHAKLVKDLAKQGVDVLKDLTAESADALHAVIGIAGESGELVDAVKKYAIYNKPIDRENIVEELGDLEFYLQQLRSNLGITREETLQHNIEKLNKRYSQGSYSNNQAINRADKK
jgi:NTP pyrophosphatase (non-canonical NTP hydrolase)